MEACAVFGCVVIGASVNGKPTVSKTVTAGSTPAAPARVEPPGGMGEGFPHAFGVTARRSRAPEGQSPYGERSAAGAERQVRTPAAPAMPILAVVQDGMPRWAMPGVVR